jgi:hypothetical protein
MVLEKNVKNKRTDRIKNDVFQRVKEEGLLLKIFKIDTIYQ